MIVFVILSILIIAQIIVRFTLNEKFKNISNNLNIEMTKFEIVENHKKKNLVAGIVGFIVVLIIFTFPVALNVLLYMHFPKEMLIGKLNLCFSFILSFSIFMVANLIQYKIIKCYIHEFKVANPNVSNDQLPNISFKDVFVLDLTNILTTAICIALTIALYFII